MASPLDSWFWHFDGTTGSDNNGRVDSTCQSLQQGRLDTLQQRKSRAPSKDKRYNIQILFWISPGILEDKTIEEKLPLL